MGTQAQGRILPPPPAPLLCSMDACNPPSHLHSNTARGGHNTACPSPGSTPTLLPNPPRQPVCTEHQPACNSLPTPKIPTNDSSASYGLLSRVSLPGLTSGRTLRAAVKQSTALSYSPLRLKSTPKPHCTSGSMDAGSRRTAARNSSFTSRNKELEAEEPTHQKKNKSKDVSASQTTPQNERARPPKCISAPPFLFLTNPSWKPTLLSSQQCAGR